MVSSTASVVRGETFFEYAGVTAGKVDKLGSGEALAVALKLLAAAAAVGATATHFVPTVGLANSAASSSSLAGDPPDLFGLLPTAWSNIVMLDRTAPAPARASSALQELKRLRRYQDGWNGPRSLGAVAPSFDAAEHFVAMLLAHRSGKLSVEPTIFARGNAAVEVSSPAFEAVFEFDADGSVAGVMDMGGSSIEVEWAHLGNTLPKELLAHI